MENFRNMNAFGDPGVKFDCYVCPQWCGVVRCGAARYHGIGGFHCKINGIKRKNLIVLNIFAQR